jgi:hypothetical protein
MTKWLWSAGVAAVALVASVATGSAATLVSDGAVGDVSINTTSPISIIGQVATAGTDSLAYGADYEEFSVTPPGISVSGNTITVSLLTAANWTDFGWGLFNENPNALGATPVVTGNQGIANVTLSNPPADYFLAFTSDGNACATRGGCADNFSVVLGTDAVFTPLPGTLALLAGGLGLIGFAGRKRRQKSQVSLGSFSAAN